MDKLGRVAVLYGGTSAERAISLKSGAAVLAALQQQGIAAEGIEIGLEVTEPHWLMQLRGFDRVFIVLHGRGGEDGALQGALELLKLPYTGSGLLASALGMDKQRTKQVWQSLALPTPAYCRLESLEQCTAAVLDQLGGAVMVKPAREGSSIGMSRATTVAELQAAWQSAAEYDSVIIAEQWIHGREYTVAIVNDRPLPVIRLETSHLFYDYAAKYVTGDTRYQIPSGLSAADEVAMQQLALTAYRALGCRGWGRVDLMADAAGSFWLLEVNTVPGMTNHSLVPKAAAAAGIDFAQLTRQIVEAATLDG